MMNSDVSVVRGSEYSDSESPYPEAPCLLATPALRIAHKEKWEARQERGRRVPQKRGRQRSQKKEQRRRDGAHPTPCQLTQLPSELLLKVMHHMDKGSLKSFVLTSRRMYHVREANAIAVFKGMQREQFPGYLSVFGDPTKGNEEQVKEMEFVARESDWWRDAPRPRVHDRRTLWWQHFTNLAIIRENIDAETTALRNMPGGNSFDSALSKDAILLQWRLGLRMAQTKEEDGQRQIQMFLNHPAEVQQQLLKIGQFLGAKIENQVGLAATAGCWARLGAHLPEVGTLEEAGFVEWISTRVIAYALGAVFRCGPRGIAELFKYAKVSSKVSQIRFDFVQVLADSEAQDGKGKLDMVMMMGQAIGYHDLTFANTKQQVESLLQFWRRQLADNHMIHLNPYVGIQALD